MLARANRQSGPNAGLRDKMPATPNNDTTLWRAGLAIVMALMLARIIGLILSPVELHGDEAQYWTWSHQLAFGYYSKPPAIAWIIALTTHLFGDAEWAIRLASPIFHTATALLIAGIGRTLFTPATGALAGLLYATMPGVALSSGLISTDALLLTSWSAALLSLIILRNTKTWLPAITLGIAIGTGLLTKYAMIYFAVGVVIASLLDAPLRRAVLSPKGMVAGLIALAILSPNLMWNAANDFSTMAHTADNANWSAQAFNPENLGDFWADQLAVFGPFTLLFLLAAIGLSARTPKPTRTNLVLLLAFLIPPLAIVSVQAFISRAHGNWAAAAYVAAPIILAGWAVAPQGALAGRKLLSLLFTAAIAFNIAAGGLFFASGLNLTIADRLCLPGGRDCIGEGFKRVRGWQDLADELTARVDADKDGISDYSAVLFDNRLVFHDMEYYLRDKGFPLRMWLRQYPNAKSHAEQRAPITAADDANVLVVSMRAHEHDNLQADFASWTVLDTYDIDRGSAGPLTISFFQATGFAPLERGPDYEAVYGE